jgi:hypothetical protein
MPSALAVAASANATKLSFIRCDTFEQDAVRALLANRRMTFLAMVNEVVEGGVEQLAAMPSLDVLIHTVNIPSRWRESIERSWASAGKSKHDLIFA